MEFKENTNLEFEILEVAERLFLEKGFAKTSTVEIARVVGCNQAMVHYYFRSKEKLFNAIFEKNARILYDSMLSNKGKTTSFEDQLTKIIGNHFDFLIDHPRIPILIFNELLTNPTRLASYKNTMSEMSDSLKSHINNELQVEIEKGTVYPTTTIDLILTIVSLNVMLFLTSPLTKSIHNISDEDYNFFLEKRKQENIRIVLASLKP